MKNINIKVKNNANQLLELDEIKKLLQIHGNALILVFDLGKVDDDYRKFLQHALPKYHVFNKRWGPEMWIVPSMETDQILEQKEEIHKAARSFREDGIKLMKALGRAYQINPFVSDELFALKQKSRENKQRGKVDKEWDFWFHGAECQFKNRYTGQIVELVITHGPEFGALDSFFFLRYLKTTDRFKNLADFFGEDLSVVTKALNVLEDLGLLERIDQSSQRGIIAK